MAIICLLPTTMGGTQVTFVDEITFTIRIVLVAENDLETVTGKPLVVWNVVGRPTFPRTGVHSMGHETDVVLARLLAISAALTLHIAVATALLAAAVTSSIVVDDNEIVRGVDLRPWVVPWDVGDSNGVVRQDLEIFRMSIYVIELVLENILVGTRYHSCLPCD